MTFFDEITGFFRGLFGDGAVGYVLDENTLVFVIFGMLLALISAFFGFKTFKFWCAFVGFVAFYVLGMMLAGLFLPAGWPQIVMALVCALVGAVLAFMLVKAGVFIVCAGLTFGIVYALTSGLWPVAGVVAIIIGVLSWWVSDYIVMVVTSVAGGFMLGGGISYFLPSMAPVLVVIVSIALAAAGFIVQMAMYRRSERYKAAKAVKKKDEPVKAVAAPAQAGGDKSADHKDV